MTEIKIEKKKPAWPWILVVIIVALAGLAIWLFMTPGDSEINLATTDDTGETALVNIQENNETVNSYVMFIENDPDTMGLDHEYTHEALTKLTNAVETMANKADFNVEADITRAKELADSITRDPFATTHANKISSAAHVLCNALQNLQQAKYPGLNSEVAAVKSAAGNINPEVLTLDQRNEVKSFFRKSAELLKKMN